MQGLTRDVKMLAALRDADGGNGLGLLDAARKMTGALSDLLNAAQPDNQEPRSNLLGAATKASIFHQTLNKITCATSRGKSPCCNHCNFSLYRCSNVF